MVNPSNIQEVRDARPDEAGVRSAADRLSKKGIAGMAPESTWSAIRSNSGTYLASGNARSLLSALQAYKAGFSE